jgi:hypothetical protein
MLDVIKFIFYLPINKNIIEFNNLNKFLKKSKKFEILTIILQCITLIFLLSAFCFN